MKKFAFIIIILCFLSCGIYIIFTLNAAAQKPIEFTYSNFFPFAHFNSQLIASWIEQIEKRTNGAVKISLHSDGGGYKGNEIFDAVEKGNTDIGMSILGYTPTRFPAMIFVDLPMGYPNGRVATCVINKFCARFKLTESGKDFENVKLLYLQAHGPGIIHSQKPIYSLDDIKGIKVRTHGFGIKIIQALGGIPVGMPQAEAYSALQKKLVDATLSPLEVLKGWKQAEVIKYTVESSCIGYTSGMFVTMNKEKWESLPENVQKVFDEVSAEWIPKHGKAWDTADKSGLYYSLSLRNKINPLNAKERTRWVQALKPEIDTFAEEAEEKGIPGKEYVKALQELIQKCTKETK